MQYIIKLYAISKKIVIHIRLITTWDICIMIMTFRTHSIKSWTYGKIKKPKHREKEKERGGERGRERKKEKEREREREIARRREEGREGGREREREREKPESKT